MKKTLVFSALFCIILTICSAQSSLKKINSSNYHQRNSFFTNFNLKNATTQGVDYIMKESPKPLEKTQNHSNRNILLDEGFETWPPAGWNHYVFGTIGEWFQDLSGGHTGDHSALHDEYTTPDSVNTWLVSPQLFLDQTNYWLTVYEYSSQHQYEDRYARIMISTGSANPEDGDYELLRADQMAFWWKYREIDLSSYYGEEIYIAFNCIHHTCRWHVDDVLIAPVDYIDGELTGIINPSGFSPTGSLEDVVVKITNVGSEIITDLSVIWKINDVVQPEFFASGLNLVPEQDIDIIIGEFDFSEIGCYTIDAEIIIDEDIDLSNNTATGEYSVGYGYDLVIQKILPSGNYPNSGERNVNIRVYNNGASILTDFDVFWSINNVQQTVVEFNGLEIMPGQASQLYIGEYDFTEGIHNIAFNIPIEYDLNPLDNSDSTIFSVGSIYEGFQGDFPPLLWTIYTANCGNWQAQNQDPTNMHANLVSINNMFGWSVDTLYTPLLNIEAGDIISFKGAWPVMYPGDVSLIWKDGSTGEVHILENGIGYYTDWHDFSFDISEAEGNNYIGWICYATYIGDFNIDDISSTAPIFLFENDLLINDFNISSITPLVNTETTISFCVKNVGTENVLANEYSLNILNNDVLITTVNGIDIESYDEAVFEIPYSFNELSHWQISIEINYPDDNAPHNNISQYISVYPIPENSNNQVIGNIDNYSSYLPFNVGGIEAWGGDQDMSQVIYYADELGESGMIYGIRYYYHNFSYYGTTMPVKMWIAQTNLTNLDDGWYPYDEFTLVFDRIIETVHGFDNYVYIPFSEPFYFDGTSNIIIQSYAHDPSFLFSNTKFIETEGVGENRSLAIIEEEYIDPANPPYSGLTGWANKTYPYCSFVTVTQTEQTFDLEEGFQFISSSVDPVNPDMLIVMADLLDENLDFARNSQGAMLRKIGPNWVNGIGNWIVEEGYLVKMLADDSFSIVGSRVNPETPIPVSTGYQFVSYIPENPMDALLAFETIIGDDLDFVRNSGGQMLRKIGPNWVNGIGDLLPSEGYLVKMFADGEIIYPATAKSSGKTTTAPSHFIFEGGNAAEPVYTIYIDGLEIGDEVAAYNGDVILGSMKVNSDNVYNNALPVFNQLTNGQGYVAGEPISLKVWSDDIVVTAEFEMESVYNSYVSDVYPDNDGEFSVVSVTKGAMLAGELLIYPNPATDVINIASPSDISNVTVINYVGQSVYSSKVNSSNVQINSNNFEAGVYIIRIKTDKGVETHKIIIK